MTRKTSIEAYNTIKQNGLLSQRRFEVYDFVFHNGPVTAKQVWKTINPNVATGGITTRLSELRDLGLIDEVGLRIDETTGMNVTLWDVTGKLPIKPEKKKKKEVFTVCKAHRMFVTDDMSKCMVDDLFACSLTKVYER